MKRFALFVVLFGALFPFGWLTLYSAPYRSAFTHVFASPSTHLLMHAAIFLGLGYLLAVCFSDQAPTKRRLLTLIVVVVLIAILQETFQLMYKSRPPGEAEWFDLGTDTVGGAVGIILYGVRKKAP